MSDKDQLQAFRQNLVDKLAELVHRDTSPTDAKLAKIATVKTSIDAVDFILQNDIPEPPPLEPFMMIG